MPVNRQGAQDAHGSQGSETFRKNLYQQVARQTAPYALLCLYIDSSNGGAINDENTTNTPIDWHKQVANAIGYGTSASMEMVVDHDNDHHIAIIVSPCSLSKSDELARLIRTQLLQSYPAHRLSLGAAQIVNREVDIESLLNELRTALSANIQAGSSSIQIKQY